MKNFNGKVVVITGAASGIGRALAEQFASAGSRLVISDVDAKRLDRVGASLSERGADVVTALCDTANEDEVDELATTAMNHFGAVHILCNNAGIAGLGDPWTGTMDLWHRVVGVNLYGVIHGVRSFLPIMNAQGEGHIVNTASMAGLVAMPGGAPYNVTKHGVVALSEGLYLELKSTGSPVEVSVLCPGWVKTELMRAETGDVENPMTNLMREYARSSIDGGIAPEEVAAEVLDAVANNRFWILTHPDTRQAPVDRMRRAAEQSNPTLAAV